SEDGDAPEATSLVEFGLAATERLIELRLRNASGKQSRDLAALWNNLALRRSAVGDLRGALAAQLQAVRLWRRIAREALETEEIQLPGVLLNLADILASVGRPRAALRAALESIEILR